MAILHVAPQAMTRRALVTGAGRFPGPALCEFLEGRNWDVVRTDVEGEEPRQDMLACDLTRPEQIESLLEQAGAVTHIFHLAAHRVERGAILDPSQALEANFQAIIHLTSAAQRIVPGLRFIFAGSSEIYGPPASTPVTEDHPFNPQDPFAITMAAADHYCRYLAETAGMDVLRLRRFEVGGPGQPGDCALSGIARQVAEIEANNAESILRASGLEAKRDYTHIGDALGAYESAALLGERGEAYNICSGEGHSVREALDILVQLSTATITVELDSERLPKGSIPEIRGSRKKFTAATGWKPEKSFREIVVDLLDDWREKVATRDEAD